MWFVNFAICLFSETHTHIAIRIKENTHTHILWALFIRPNCPPTLLPFAVLISLLWHFLDSLRSRGVVLVPPLWTVFSIAPEPFATKSWHLAWLPPIQARHYEAPGHSHFVYLGFFHSCHLRSGQSRGLAHYKPIGGGILKLLIVKINNILRTQTYQNKYCFHTLLHVFLPYFAFLTRCDVTSDVTGLLLSQRRFSSITFDPIQIESKKGYHYDDIEPPNRLICSLTS